MGKFNSISYDMKKAVNNAFTAFYVPNWIRTSGLPLRRTGWWCKSQSRKVRLIKGKS